MGGSAEPWPIRPSTALCVAGDDATELSGAVNLACCALYSERALADCSLLTARWVCFCAGLCGIREGSAEGAACGFVAELPYPEDFPSLGSAELLEAGGDDLGAAAGAGVAAAAGAGLAPEFEYPDERLGDGVERPEFE